MSKHFILNPKKVPVSKELINKSRKEGELVLLEGDEKRFSVNKDKIEEKDDLKFVPGRVILKIDDKGKDIHTFQNGTTIRIERRFNNFNKRETHPVNAIVISAENIPQGSEILIHPNEIHDSNKIFDYKENNSDVGYYSIKQEQCFAWYDGEKWRPLPGFDFALRIYKPYSGFISGIEHELLKDYLYVTTGELKGKVVKTLIASDYEIIFQGHSGKEERILRFRPFGNEKENREPEAICIMKELTDKVNGGELLIGLSQSDAKIKID